MKSSFLLRTFAASLGGVVAGVLVTTLVRVPTGSPAARAATSKVKDESTPAVRAAGVVSNLDRERLSELERQVGELSARQADAGETVAPPSNEPLDRERRAQLALDQHTKFLEKHRAEPRDAAWAPAQERTVTTTLTALSETMKRSFSVRSVDCQTASCVAELEWPSEGAARSDLRALLADSDGVDCAREITLPAASGDGPYSASIYIDCTEKRWGGTPQGR